MALCPTRWVLCTISLFLWQAITPTVASSSVELVNNGFDGVVVVISPMISETYAKDINLLQAIKKTMKEGSQALFEATHNRAFFRKVDILIPNSWNNTAVDATVSTNYKDGQIRIDIINPIYKEQPYTEQVNLDCGAPGEYIHLTPQFLTDDNQVQRWGNRGKNMATEWAKFRWGIFDELGYPADDKYPLFYQGAPNIIEGGSSFSNEPTLCADRTVEGLFIDTATNKAPCKYKDDGSPDANCRFIPYTTGQEAKSSLLSYGYIRHDVSLFCDDNEHSHNTKAPTKQNDLCNRQSAWSVIMQHQDFSGNRNSPINEKEEIQFEIVQQVSDANFVLVLDYSGSMGNYQRIDKLQRTTQSWIIHDVEEGNSIAIVKFASLASTQVALTKISSSNRQSIANNIDRVAVGGTCIGCGLREALKILQGKKNCVIIVLTDGEENESPKIIDVNSEVISSGCRVVTVAFGPNAAQELEDLAKSTSGKTFSVNDDDSAEINLSDAFDFALEYQPEQDPLSANIKISESTPYRSTDTTYTEQFVVDKGLGRNLELRLMTDNLNHITVPPVLIGPDGKEYQTTATDSNRMMWIVQVKSVMSGTWKFRVGLSGNYGNFISSTVTCQPDAQGELPITVEAWTNAKTDGVDLNRNRIVIYAKVKQGNNPVTGADVKALITLPDAANSIAPIEVVLLDGGSGPDLTQGDGIYSRYLTGVTIRGRIIVKAQVKNGINSFIYKGSTPSKRKKRDARTIDYYPDRCCGSVVPLERLTAEPTGDFNRNEVAGSVKITGVPDPGKDIYPPTRVRDLTVVNIQRDNTHITSIVYHTTFTWTAPGDDLDSGIVSQYSLRFSQNQTHLYENNFNSAKEYALSHELYANILQEAGTKVSLNISLKLQTFLEGVPYYFALNAKDEAGNTSPVSNIVHVILHPPPPPPAPVVTIISTTSSSLHVSWTIDSSIISKFVVTWTSNSDESNSTEVTKNTKDLVINGLLCNTKYKVTVTVHVDQNVNSEADSLGVYATTNDEAPGKPTIEKLDLNDSDPTKLVIHWSEAEYSCSGGLLNYQITWQTDITDKLTLSRTHYYNETISNIMYDTVYNVTVAARSFTGILGPMDSQTVMSPSTGLWLLHSSSAWWVWCLICAGLLVALVALTLGVWGCLRTKSEEEQPLAPK